MEYLPSYTDSLYLTHHGIQGQKWGVRRFQNEDGSLTNSGKERYSDNKKEKGFHLTEKQKKYLKIGLAVAGTALAAYGGYKIAQGFDITRMPNFDSATKLLKKRDALNAVEDAKKVNPNAWTGLQEYLTNCSKCSASYELRRRGFDVKAMAETEGFGKPLNTISKYFKNAFVKNSGLNNIRTASGLNVIPFDPMKLTSAGLNMAISRARTEKLYNPKGYKKLQEEAAKELVRNCEDLGPGARGHIGMFWENGGGHSIAFENTKDGKVIFHDAQIANLMESASGSGTNGEYFKNYICNTNPFIQMRITRTDNAEPNYEYLLNNDIITNRFNPLESQETQIGLGLAAAGLVVVGGVAVSAIRARRQAKQNTNEKSEEDL